MLPKMDSWLISFTPSGSWTVNAHSRLVKMMKFILASSPKHKRCPAARSWELVSYTHTVTNTLDNVHPLQREGRVPSTGKSWQVLMCL